MSTATVTPTADPGTIAPGFERIVETAAQMVGARDALWGLQLEISIAGDVVVDVAIGTDGLEQPLERDSLLAVYCSAKPVTALAFAQLVEAGEVSFDDRLADVLDDPRLHDALAHTTFADLLSHTAGVPAPMASVASMLPRAVRDEVALAAPLPPGVTRGAASYSEFRGWHLLGLAIEGLTGEDLGSRLRRTVLRPLGVDDDVFVGMTEDEYDRAAVLTDRLRCNVDISGPRPVPFLVEQARWFATSWNPGTGGVASARGLGAFYRALAAIRRGNDPTLDRAVLDAELLAEITTPRARPGRDLVLDRSCSFGLGFMTDLSAHGFGAASAASFGHSGFAASSWAFADPEHDDLVIAASCVGMLDGERSLALRRERLCRLAYTALDQR